ncbi:hypothetical protein BWQ96_08351 [Gracilariopsis chorda]|uniref:Uncharacterized protein n=1 Tax=Gracilariopsis chorda TaxID=448386 RepID=A0A2V3IIP2_9FLOR|nr:hypothetical protein BWQ96_08351 [Gracilariopsis chorda]|eukprot:PXF41941.1 hypothetical protein BWQ96_08351 [Gracilariopsis chorda]
MEAPDRSGLYPRMPFFQDIDWQDFWRVSNLLAVPTPPLAAYHSRQMVNDPTDRRLTWKVLTVEWAVFVLMAFLDTCRFGVRCIVRSNDYRVWSHDNACPSPVRHLVRLPRMIIVYLRGLGIQKLVRDTACGAERVENLLDYVLRMDWANTPGYHWYDYEADNVQAILHHLSGMDDCKSYPAFPLRAVPDVISRKDVANYYPKGRGFSVACLAPDDIPLSLPTIPSGVEDLFGGEPVDPIPSGVPHSAPVVTEPFVPAVVAPTVDPPTIVAPPPAVVLAAPEAVAEPVAATPALTIVLEVTTAGVSVAPLLEPSRQVIAGMLGVATYAALESLSAEMIANGYTGNWRLGDILMTARSWLRRSVRLEALQAETQELRSNLANVLQENMASLSQGLTENLDERFGLNLVHLTDSEGSHDLDTLPKSVPPPAVGSQFKRRKRNRPSKGGTSGASASSGGAGSSSGAPPAPSSSGAVPS